jgi:hypothetical protein
MLDLSLGDWRIWHEKVWVAIYLVLSDTWILEISFEKLENPHEEILYDKGWIPTRALHVYLG